MLNIKKGDIIFIKHKGDAIALKDEEFEFAEGIGIDGFYCHYFLIKKKTISFFYKSDKYIYKNKRIVLTEKIQKCFKDYEAIRG